MLIKVTILNKKSNFESRRLDKGDAVGTEKRTISSSKQNCIFYEMFLMKTRKHFGKI